MQNGPRNCQSRVYGPEHRDVAVGLQALGQLLTAQNDFAAARPVLERALAIREAAFGPDNIEVAVSLSDLGLLCYYKGELEQARALFQRAVAIQDRRLPGDNPALVNNYYNLACVTALLGNRPGALACLRRAVEGGFADPYLDEDPDLGSLHGDPEYQQLVRTVKTRAAGR